MTSIVQKVISDKVQDKTMRLFWKKGFFSTSIDDIVEVTGFNRAAIYKYFGGKNHLFLEMLKRYRKEITPIFTAPLQNAALGLEAIENFFGQFVGLNQSTMPCGCFLIATASNLPAHDDAVAEFIRGFSHDLHQLFCACLEGAIEKKELASTADQKAIADFLVVNLFGLLTWHRVGVPTSFIKNHVTIVKQFLKTLFPAKH
ncbi:MAG: TetR/AcrR family transcriptional regulator [Gammaproteobacteria bacterium]|nr:TetR/AcrR family transcriptional regulator [Gammaproteobacteria bacterium]